MKIFEHLNVSWLEATFGQSRTIRCCHCSRHGKSENVMAKQSKRILPASSPSGGPYWGRFLRAAGQVRSLVKPLKMITQNKRIPQNSNYGLASAIPVVHWTTKTMQWLVRHVAECNMRREQEEHQKITILDPIHGVLFLQNGPSSGLRERLRSLQGIEQNRSKSYNH